MRAGLGGATGSAAPLPAPRRRVTHGVTRVAEAERSRPRRACACSDGAVVWACTPLLIIAEREEREEREERRQNKL